MSNGSHMFTAETIIQLFEGLYSPAFKIKRSQLGLGLEHRGLLMADAFTGAHTESGGYAARRKRWSSQENVLLPASQPGGWSAKAQPCDQLFSHYKHRVRIKMDTKLGFGDSYFNRAKYEQLSIAATGVG